jgi:uncharacterized protein YqgC (DUF456 family)
VNGLGEFLFGLAMAVGLVGIVVPVLPGSLLIMGAAVLWALEVGGVGPWVVVAVMALLVVTGTVVKYQVPGRELTAQDVSRRTWVLALVLAVAGFFVVPVVGLVLGFVLGVYLGQRRDLGGHGPAWASTRRVLGGVGKGMAIEFTAAFVAVVVWVVAATTWL